MRDFFPSAPSRQSAIGFRVWFWDASRQGVMREAHTHPDVEVNYLSSGSVRYMLGGQIHDVAAGEFAVFWGGAPHVLIDRGNTTGGVWLTLPLDTFLSWQIPGHLAERLLAGQMVCDRPEDPMDRQADRFQIERWASKFEAAEKPIILLELEARMRRLALRFERTPADVEAPYRTEDRKLRRFVRITQFIAERYTQELRVEDVAAEVGLHPKYLVNFFKRIAGMTVVDYLLQLRLAHARRLLVTTDRKVIDIALESGFGSLSAFYYAFNKYHPSTKPAAWRRRMLAG